jgi:hypothetical protein
MLAMSVPSASTRACACARSCGVPAPPSTHSHARSMAARSVAMAGARVGAGREAGCARAADAAVATTLTTRRGSGRLRLAWLCGSAREQEGTSTQGIRESRGGHRARRDCVDCGGGRGCKTGCTDANGHLPTPLAQTLRHTHQAPDATPATAALPPVSLRTRATRAVCASALTLCESVRRVAGGVCRPSAARAARVHTLPCARSPPWCPGWLAGAKRAWCRRYRALRSSGIWSPGHLRFGSLRSHPASANCH